MADFIVERLHFPIVVAAKIESVILVVPPNGAAQRFGKIRVFAVLQQRVEVVDEAAVAKVFVFAKLRLA